MGRTSPNQGLLPTTQPGSTKSPATYLGTTMHSATSTILASSLQSKMLSPTRTVTLPLSRSCQTWQSVWTTDSLNDGSKSARHQTNMNLALSPKLPVTPSPQLPAPLAPAPPRWTSTLPNPASPSSHSPLKNASVEWTTTSACTAVKPDIEYPSALNATNPDLHISEQQSVPNPTSTFCKRNR